MMKMFQLFIIIIIVLNINGYQHLILQMILHLMEMNLKLLNMLIKHKKY